MKAGTHPRWSQWMWCYSLYSSKFQHWLVQTIEKTPLSSNFNFVTIPFKVLFMSSAAPLPATLLLPFFFFYGCSVLTNCLFTFAVHIVSYPSKQWASNLDLSEEGGSVMNVHNCTMGKCHSSDLLSQIFSLRPFIMLQSRDIFQV